MFTFLTFYNVYLANYVLINENVCWIYIIFRFSNIIKGQFYGHEHTDELKLFYDKDNETPINVGFNGASVTPYLNYNPNYKIMTVDPYTYVSYDKSLNINADCQTISTVTI